MNFLNALQTIFDSSKQALFRLLNEQKSVIAISRNEIKNEQLFRNEGMT